MSTPGKRLIGYGRVSPGNNDMSVPEQERVIKIFCDSLDAHELWPEHEYDRFYSDDYVSGGVCISQRPEGRKMLMQLEPGDVVIVTCIDRLLRDHDDFAVLRKAYKDTGVVFWDMQLRVNLVGKSGAMPIVSSIMAWAAEQERKKIRERCQRGLDRNRELGIFNGRQAPYGWKLKTQLIPERGKKCKVLIENQEERDLCFLLKDMRHGRGMTMPEIAIELQERGIKPRTSKYPNMAIFMQWETFGLQNVNAMIDAADQGFPKRKGKKESRKVLGNVPPRLALEALSHMSDLS